MKGLKESSQDLAKLQEEAEGLLKDLGLEKPAESETDNQPCVVILEDDEVSTLLLTKIIKKLGLRCRSYSSPVKALAESKTFEVALLFLDIKLPEMNGLEFLVKLRELKKKPDIPVVVVTGYTHKTLVDKIVQHKVKGIIAKPVNSERVIKFLEDFGQNAKVNYST